MLLSTTLAWGFVIGVRNGIICDKRLDNNGLNRRNMVYNMVGFIHLIVEYPKLQILCFFVATPGQRPE